MSGIEGDPDSGTDVPHSPRLAELVLLPAPPSPRERLDQALGPDLARFLVAALLAGGQGRVGSSSP